MKLQAQLKAPSLPVHLPCLLYTSVFGKPSLKGDVTSPDNLFKFQAMVMRELAEQEPCVFVGRAAGYVLDQDEEIENLVRIFVYADRVRRVQRVMEVDCISEELSLIHIL